MKAEVGGCEVEAIVGPRWKMADGKSGMEDEGGAWGWKNPEDGTSAQYFAHPWHACNW